ncbi:hypothetical protein [Streptosporangium longisporum]|uniref:Uncharacterized protein n=1 Tax=Streptosporangium longisporum TaxID=46187 RepID=A0ABP6LEU5_9ACTN
MLHLTAGISPIEAAFQAGYASCAQTASDLVELAGADPERWMAASRNILSETELAELAQAAAQILARRGGMAVAA